MWAACGGLDSSSEAVTSLEKQEIEVFVLHLEQTIQLIFGHLHLIVSIHLVHLHLGHLHPRCGIPPSFILIRSRPFISLHLISKISSKSEVPHLPQLVSALKRHASSYSSL